MTILNSNKCLLGKQKFYTYIFLLIFGQSVFSQPRNLIQPIMGFAPLWVMAEYGLYWGVSLSGGIELGKHHTVFVSADLCPVGLLGMTDVDTEGKEQYWGGTFSYLFTMAFANNVIRFQPGATLGLSSIPYIYGTFPASYIDSSLNSPSRSDENPGRENIWGVGPEMRISTGKRKVQFFVDGRILFAKNHNTGLLTTAGVSLQL